MVSGQERAETRRMNIEHRTPNIEHRMGEKKDKNGMNAQPVIPLKTGSSTRNPSAFQSTINNHKSSIQEPATILIVEDNPDNMVTIKALLQNKYNILEATDGEEGLKMALSERPDLVLLDMSLPKLDGFEVVGKIKADEKAHNIPVIALTARAMKGDRERTIDAGCDDYVSKPVDPEKLMGKIGYWVLGIGD